MNEIIQFVDDLFENIHLKKQALQEKQDIIQHLTETVEDLVREGNSLPISIETAIRQFGNKDEIQGELIQLYGTTSSGVTSWKENGVTYLTHLLKGTIPDDEIKRMVSRLKENEPNALDSLKKITNIDSLAKSLEREEDELIAAVLLRLKPSQASQILQSLHREKMVSVSISMAKGEISSFVQLLNFFSKNNEKELLETLKKQEYFLTKKILDELFSFSLLLQQDLFTLQRVLAHITDNELIARALKTVSEDVKKEFYSSIPKARQVLIEEAMESLGAVKLVDIEEAQHFILNVAKKLEKEGVILIFRGDEDGIL